jgi:hypothetical protein
VVLLGRCTVVARSTARGPLLPLDSRGCAEQVASSVALQRCSYERVLLSAVQPV